MTDKQELLALASAVEKLEGPCRETDVLIALAINWKHESMVITLRHLHEGLGEPLLSIVKDANGTQSIIGQLPHYTGSIDGAMTLVPKGARLQFQNFGDTGNRSMWLISPNERFVSAATPALALCAAALRARASITRTTGDGDGNNG